MQIPGVHLELRKRIRLPFGAPATPLPAAEVEDRLETGRVQVRLRPEAPAVPVANREQLQELAFFTGVAIAAPAHATLAARLVTLDQKGWQFHSPEGEVGPYGAYRGVQSDAKLEARRGEVQVDLTRSSLERWGDSELAWLVGPDVVTLYEKNPEGAARALRSQNRHETSVLLAETVLGQPLPCHSRNPAVRSAVAQVWLEHPQDGLAAARELVSTHPEPELQAAAPALLQDQKPLTRLVASALRMVGPGDSQACLLEAAGLHSDNPRAAGAAIIDALLRRRQPVDAVTVGELFTGQLELPEAAWVEKTLSPSATAALYRAALRGAHSPVALVRQAMAGASQDDATHLATLGMKQLDPTRARAALMLFYRHGLSPEARQAVVQAALEHDGEPASTGRRALESRLKEKDAREIGWEFARSLSDWPSARLALQLAPEPGARFDLPLYKAALKGPKVGAAFVKSALAEASELDRWELTAMLAEACAQGDERLQQLLQRMPFPDPDQLVKTLETYEQLHVLQNRAPAAGVEMEPEAVRVNGVRVKKRAAPDQVDA